MLVNTQTGRIVKNVIRRLANNTHKKAPLQRGFQTTIKLTTGCNNEKDKTNATGNRDRSNHSSGAGWLQIDIRILRGYGQIRAKLFRLRICKPHTTATQ